MRSELINKKVILIADDDPDDRTMILDAFRESNSFIDLYFVVDGEELTDYLRRKNKYKDKEIYPMPSLILLDLNMPRKDGREALQEIKSDPMLRKIPVIIFTTSSAEEDIIKTYDLGVNSFLTKPLSYKALVNLTAAFSNFWLDLAVLPPQVKK